MDKAAPVNADAVDSPGANPGASSERRFAYSLLEKLIQYLDVAAFNMKHLRPSGNYSRRMSFKTSTRDVKFFSKVPFNPFQSCFNPVSILFRSYFDPISIRLHPTSRLYCRSWRNISARTASTSSWWPRQQTASELRRSKKKKWLRGEFLFEISVAADEIASISIYILIWIFFKVYSANWRLWCATNSQPSGRKRGSLCAACRCWCGPSTQSRWWRTVTSSSAPPCSCSSTTRPKISASLLLISTMYSLHFSLSLFLFNSFQTLNHHFLVFRWHNLTRLL